MMASAFLSFTTFPLDKASSMLSNSVCTNFNTQKCDKLQAPLAKYLPPLDLDGFTPLRVRLALLLLLDDVLEPTLRRERRR